MTVEFDSVVTLVSKAEVAEASEGKLILDIKVDREVPELVSNAHRWSDADVFYNNKPFLDPLDRLPVGDSVKLVLSHVVSDSRAVFQCLDELITYQYGIYQTAPPREYHLIDEQYTHGRTDVDANSRIGKFQRLPDLVQILQRVSDLVVPGNPKTLVFIADVRFDVVMRVTPADLVAVPSREEISATGSELAEGPLSQAKSRIFKRVLKRMLENQADEQKFPAFIAAFSAIREAFRADYQLFEAEFNFDRLRQAFEEKRLNYMLKLDGAATDTLTKLLAIPVGQGLLVSQMKQGADTGNLALFLAAIVFAVIAFLILLNQRHSASQIGREINRESSEAETEFGDQYKKLRPQFRALKRRVCIVKTMPFFLGVLLVATTWFSYIAYLRLGTG